MTLLLRQHFLLHWIIQWLPDEIIADDSDMKGQFMHYGFEAECVQQFLETYQMKNLYLAFDAYKTDHLKQGIDP